MVEVIAHRGASAVAPEHTVAAFDRALAEGADALELDVRATADGELVVIHDATLLRVTGRARRIGRLDRAQLRALPAAVRPLTLDEVLGRYGRATRWLIELKDPDPAWERQVPALLARHGLTDRAVLQSFDYAALRRLHGHHAAPPVAAILRRRPGERRLTALADFVAGVSVAHVALDRATVRRAHDAGLAVRAWTVNAPAAVTRMAALGVEGVITDAPARTRAVLADGRLAA